MKAVQGLDEGNSALARSPRCWATLDALPVGGIPLVVLWALGDEEYLLSALFGALLALLADPGGDGHRASPCSR